MFNIEIIAAGKMKAGPLGSLWDEYKKRTSPWKVSLHEITGRDAAQEQQKLIEKINPRAYLIVLDEKGKSVSSADFATRLDKQAASGQNHIQFLIGGADGLSPEIRQKAGFVLSFGAQTWPHMLARVMLIEQIYRAKQILSGHPYHRE